MEGIDKNAVMMHVLLETPGLLFQTFTIVALLAVARSDPLQSLYAGILSLGACPRMMNFDNSFI